jgi:SAM-dependent methyltransferase
MYEQTAKYYDLVHAELKDDIPLVLTLAGQGKGPILELGCGTGRLLLPLARAGYEVIGLDNSPAMLAKAKARLSGRGMNHFPRLGWQGRLVLSCEALA